MGIRLRGWDSRCVCGVVAWLRFIKCDAHVGFDVPDLVLCACDAGPGHGVINSAGT